MFLNSLSLFNFRCYESLSNIPIRRLTIFVGENDAGKTVLLDALQILVENRRPIEHDYRQIDEDTRATEMTISGTFAVDDQEELPADWRNPDGKTVTVIKTFSGDSSRVEVLGLCFENTRFHNFQNENSEGQKELLRLLGLEPAGNKAERIEQFNQANEGGHIPKVPGRVPIRFDELASYMPRFERIAAADYRQPHLLVQKTLQMVVNSCIYRKDEQTGLQVLIAPLDEVRNNLQSALDEKLADATETLKAIHPKIQQVVTRPKVDFASSVSFPELMLDFGDGQGIRPVNSVGEGTKKRLWMGLLDWQRKAEIESEDQSVLRVYDEPDTSLHYDAQRKLFSNIIEGTRRRESRTQAIVCTHSLTLIDRAAGESINLIKVDDSGTRTVEFLTGAANDDDIRQFLSMVGQAVGLSNSALFFEKAFIVVEGESEANSLPIFYRNLYGRSLPEDGIVLVNLHGNGSWKAILKLLSQNKAAIISMLLDNDCQTNPDGALVKPVALADVGFSSDFLTNQCFFVGTKEFEDAFATRDLIAVLNAHYPKADGTTWIDGDVDQFRSASVKFAESILLEVRRIYST